MKFERIFWGERVEVDTDARTVTAEIRKPLPVKGKGMMVGVNQPILNYTRSQDFYLVAKVLLNRRFYPYKVTPEIFLEKGELNVSRGIPIWMMSIQELRKVAIREFEKPKLMMLH